MSAPTRAQQYLSHWILHRGALSDLVDRLPEGSAGFRPWPQAMTTEGLVWHIVQSTDRFFQAVRTGSMPPRPAQQDVPQTIAAVRELLHARTATDRELLEGLTDAQFDAVLAFGPVGELPGVTLLGLALDHEIHHKGQLWTYARMCGVEPPSFVKRG